MDTSIMEGGDHRPLKLGKMDSQAISMQSDKKSRRKNSIFKTVEVGDPMTGRNIAKKTNLGGGGGHQSSRNAVMTQDSTLYSMNQSVESPRRKGAN